MGKENIEDQSREQIAAFLPDAIARALASYIEFAETTQHGSHDPEPTAKAFGEHHNACKVAIAHIELLLKLAKWADLPDPLRDRTSLQQLQERYAAQAKKDLVTGLRRLEAKDEND